LLAATGANVGIGESRPSNTLEIKVEGTTHADHWTIRSSRRLKTNIRPLTGALQKVEQLQGVSYDRRDDGRHEIGVVAEDVAQVVPEVVSRDPQTKEIQGVDYSRLAALLIEAVKSQQSEIEQLKARVEQLTSSNTAPK
jgi:Chaperone of endosialidase